MISILKQLSDIKIISYIYYITSLLLSPIVIAALIIDNTQNTAVDTIIVEECSTSLW